LNLLNLQETFTILIAKLIIWAYGQGYKLTLGEGYNGEDVGHMPGSLHYCRLAQDLCLFENGVYITDPEAYKPLADYWRSLSDVGYECCAGYYFASKDADHFSIKYMGKE